MIHISEDVVVRLGIDTSSYLNGVKQLQQSNADFQQSVRRLASDAANYVQRFSNAMSRLDVSTIAVTQATQRAKDAQGAYNAAVAEFGASSQQAVRAHKDLVDVKEAQERSERRLRVSQALVAADLATLTANLPKTIDRVRQLAAAQSAAAASGSAAALALGPIAVAVAAAAGSYLVYKATIEQSTKATQDLNRAQQAIVENTPKIDGPSWLDPRKINLGRVELEAVQETQKDVAGGFIALAEDFFASERRKALIAAGNEAAIRAELEKTRATMEETAAAMEHATDRATFDGLTRAWQDLNASAQVYEQQLTAIEQGSHAGMLASVGALRQQIQGLGLDAANLGPQILAGLAGISPAFGELTQQIAATRAEERDLARHILASGNPALVAQMQITKGKAETSEELAAALGITVEQEKALEEQGVITTGVLQGQARAVGGATSSMRARTNTAPDLASLIDANIGKIVGSAWGMDENSARVQFNQGRYNGSDILDTLMGREHDGQNFAQGELLGSAAMRGNVKQTIEALVMSLPSSMWDGLLKQMQTTGKVPGFAHGFDGIVRGPSLFLAGEHGPERVSVSPMSRGARGGSGGIVVNGGIHVHANDARGGRDAADEIMRRLSRLGVQGQIF